MLDFFPEYGLADDLKLVMDDEVISSMTAPRYQAELARTSEHSRERPLSSPNTPPYPRLRRVAWEAGDIYIPGRILAPVDRGLGRIVSFEVQGPTNWSITRPRPLRAAPIRVAGRAILIKHMKHYGHLLTDMLGPIALAVHQGLISRENPVAVIRAREDNPVTIAFAEGLLRMGVASEVIPLGRDQSVEVDRLLHCEVLASSGEHRYAMPEATPLLREIFRLGHQDEPGEPGPAPERVYITRGGAKLRHVAGEAELIEGLRARGFHIFEPRWANHREQIAVFSSCRILVGVHGAGLANAIFGQAGARLIEIMAFDARKTTGLFWASCAGMDYTSVFGGAEARRQSFPIDPAAVLREIDPWLS